MIILEKLDRVKPVSVVYFNSTKKMFYIKRFEIGILKGDQKYVEIAKNIQVEMVSTDWKPVIELVFKGKKPLEKENINVAEFIAVKGIKAIGNQLSRKEIKEYRQHSPSGGLMLESFSKNLSQKGSYINLAN